LPAYVIHQDDALIQFIFIDSFSQF